MHFEIRLPDEHGRQQILDIHTKYMRSRGHLDASVSTAVLAAQTENFSGAELEGLIRSATSFALNRKDMGVVSVTSEDFERALEELRPAHGSPCSCYQRSSAW